MPDIAISLYGVYHLCRHFSESYLCIDIFLYHPCSRFSLSSASTCVCIIFCAVCVHTSLCHLSAHFSVIGIHTSLCHLRLHVSIFCVLPVCTVSCVICVHVYLCYLCSHLSVSYVSTFFRVSCVHSIFFVSYVCTFIRVMCPRCFRSSVHIYFLYPHSSEPFFKYFFLSTCISLYYLCSLLFLWVICAHISQHRLCPYCFVLSVATCLRITSIHVCFSACHQRPRFSLSSVLITFVVDVALSQSIRNILGVIGEPGTVRSHCLFSAKKETFSAAPVVVET